MGKEAGGPHGTVNARRPRASPAASVFLPFAKTRPPHQDCRGARLAGGGGPSRRVRGGEGLGTSGLRDRPVGRARPLGGQRAPSNPEEMKATVVAGEGAGGGQAPHAVTSMGSGPSCCSEACHLAISWEPRPRNDGPQTRRGKLHEILVLTPATLPADARGLGRGAATGAGGRGRGTQGGPRLPPSCWSPVSCFPPAVHF